MGIKEDVEQFEKKIASLKVEHEMYFMKAVKREPAKLAKLRDELDKFILNYSNKGSSNTQYKFRLNTAIAKYSSLKQYWNRVMHDIDEGKFTHRAEGGAAPAAPGNDHNGRSPATEASKDVMGAQERGLTGDSGNPPDAGEELPSRTAAHAPAVKLQAPPVQQSDEAEDIYIKFIEARRQCNEPTEGITKESLSKSIEQSKKLFEDKYKTSNVELKVMIKDGKAKLTIAPRK